MMGRDLAVKSVSLETAMFSFRLPSLYTTAFCVVITLIPGRLLGIDGGVMSDLEVVRSRTVELLSGGVGEEGHQRAAMVDLSDRVRRELFDGEGGRRPVDLYDWDRLPGTTNRIGVHPENPTGNIHTPGYSLNFGRGEFSGGAGLEEGGIAGFVLIPTHGDFVAHKSITFFPGGFLALGSGIRSTIAGDPRPVQTTVLQWASADAEESLLLSDGRRPELTDESQRFEDVTWCYIDGIGVAFFEPTGVYARRVDRVTTVWLNHGPQPEEAGYAYVLLPATSAEGIAAFATAPPVRPLQRDLRVHAVADELTGATAAAFFQAGSARRICWIVRRKMSFAMSGSAIRGMVGGISR